MRPLVGWKPLVYFLRGEGFEGVFNLFLFPRDARDAGVGITISNNDTKNLNTVLLNSSLIWQPTS